MAYAKGAGRLSETREPRGTPLQSTPNRDFMLSSREAIVEIIRIIRVARARVRRVASHARDDMATQPRPAVRR